jgi:hypothetical protein
VPKNQRQSVINENQTWGDAVACRNSHEKINENQKIFTSLPMLPRQRKKIKLISDSTYICMHMHLWLCTYVGNTCSKEKTNVNARKEVCIDMYVYLCILGSLGKAGLCAVSFWGCLSILANPWRRQNVLLIPDEVNFLFCSDHFVRTSAEDSFYSIGSRQRDSQRVPPLTKMFMYLCMKQWSVTELSVRQSHNPSISVDL